MSRILLTLDLSEATLAQDPDNPSLPGDISEYVGRRLQSGFWLFTGPGEHDEFMSLGDVLYDIRHRVDAVPAPKQEGKT